MRSRFLALLAALPFPSTASADSIAVKTVQIELQGQKLSVAYRELGSDEKSAKLPLVFFHGKYQSGRYWEESLRQAAATGRRALAPDLPGFGRSQRAALHLSFGELAHAASLVLDRLGTGKVLLVGHSFGGMLAARFALMYPERVAKLMLVSPAGLEDYRRTHRHASLDTLLAREKKLTLDSLRTLFRSFYYRWSESYEPYVTDQWERYQAADRSLTERLSAQAYQLVYEQPVAAELGELRMPVTIVVGEKDQLSLSPSDLRGKPAPSPRPIAELARITQRKIPGSRLVVMPGVGHTPPLEAPGPFADVLQRFASRNEKDEK